MSLPVVAIVGRPNVGKSTLFNRILRRRQAIVAPIPGVTRDRHIGEAEWGERNIAWVDTGGWLPEPAEELHGAVTRQILEALQDCDLILLVTDTREGLHPLDEIMAQEIRRLNLRAPVLVAANKTESDELERQAREFFALGFDPVLPISAQEGRGIGDLLDRIVDLLPEKGAEPTEEADVRVAVVGQPNVGKSSLVNRLLGEDRMIVHSRPGTTRDAVDAIWKWHGRRILLVDTAGLKRRAHSLPAVEFYGTLRALRALERAHVALFLLDGSRAFTRQDQRVASMIRESGRAVIILVNKWDLVTKETNTAREYELKVREQFPFFDFAPVLFVSSLTGQRLGRLAGEVFRLRESWTRSFQPSQLMDILEGLSLHSGEPRVKIKFARQVTTGPPTFALFVRDPSEIRDSHLRFLEDRLRSGLGLKDVPVRLWLRSTKPSG
jgi:GTP-binding protein